MVVNGYRDDAVDVDLSYALLLNTVDVDLSYALLLNIYVKRSIHKYYYVSTYRTSTVTMPLSRSDTNSKEVLGESEKSCGQN